MQCPLCGGPLHIQGPTQHACERGHQIESEQLAQAAAARVTMAFWMAIEALESEAEALRLLPSDSGGDPSLAARAVEDAQVLRGLASAHLEPLGSVDGAS